ncbi:putative enoyl-CoA hydratase echA6 [Nymphon striatum]|nr:putative enoyl-CoA hydratase echA6 [Nymphon striatum]
MNRPEKRNALSSQMMNDLTDMAATLGTDLNIRAIVLSGNGDIFCAGGDLDWMKEQIAADRETRMAEAGRLAAMLGALNTMPKPLIGRIHGAALGGGVGMACVCDVAIAQTGFARRVFMSARIFGAEEAQTLGIIAKHVDAADMDAAIAAEVEPYLNVAPAAVGAAKRLARGLGPVIDQAAIDYSIEQLANTWEGEEAAHGLDAFLTKSAPRWAKPKSD